MRPSEFAEEFVLHDSVVQHIRFAERDRTLSVDLELCNYMQPTYRDGDREMVNGTIVFSRVSRIESRPSLEAVEWGEDRMDGEILTVKPLLEPDEGIEFVIHLTDYRSRSRDVLRLSVYSEDVAWIPENAHEGE